MRAFARTFREMNRWHSESQSFVVIRWAAGNGEVGMPAFDALRKWYAGAFTIVTDLVALNVSKRRILQRRAVLSDYSRIPPPNPPGV
jgi:hypothetical protein